MYFYESKPLSYPRSKIMHDLSHPASQAKKRISI